MDSYAEHLATLVEALDLRDAVVPLMLMLSSKLVKGSTLKVHPGLSQGMCVVNAEHINRDLLAFLES